jgi:uncharacterized membrane protein YcaP (DUF421 family)
LRAPLLDASLVDKFNGGGAAAQGNQRPMRRVQVGMEIFRLLVGPDDGASLAQLCARAIVLFVFGIICIRIAGRRTFAQYSPLDIIVALVVGSNIGRVMTGKAAFFPALAATLTLVLCHRLVALASVRWPFIARLITRQPTRLIDDGKVNMTALHRAGLSRDDLLEGLRIERVDDPADVAAATLEAGGKISVIPKE